MSSLLLNVLDQGPEFPDTRKKQETAPWKTVLASGIGKINQKTTVCQNVRDQDEEVRQQ
jgi:hypothetical protein